MNRKTPGEVRAKIVNIVFNACETSGYLTQSRVENTKFMESLLENPKVGGVLSKYMSKQDMWKYLKDGIINQFPKQKAVESRPDDISTIVKKKFGFSVNELGKDKKLDSILYKNRNKDTEFVVVSYGTYEKWETALKKALLYSATHPFSHRENAKLHFLLVLFQKKPITPADEATLRKALSFAGTDFALYH